LKLLTSELPPPPGCVCGTMERRGTEGLVKCMFVTKYIEIVLLYQCKNYIVVSKYIVYSIRYERGDKGICSHHLCPPFLRFQAAPSLWFY
jgi:hypothetical protein